MTFWQVDNGLDVSANASAANEVIRKELRNACIGTKDRKTKNRMNEQQRKKTVYIN